MVDVEKFDLPDFPENPNGQTEEVTIQVPLSWQVFNVVLNNPVYKGPVSATVTLVCYMLIEGQSPQPYHADDGKPLIRQLYVEDVGELGNTYPEAKLLIDGMIQLIVQVTKDRQTLA